MVKHTLSNANKGKRDLLFNQILELCKKSNLPIREIAFVLRMVSYKVKGTKRFRKV